MKYLLIAILLLIPATVSSEWKHSNPNDLNVSYARLGQILVNVQSASIDVNYTEGRIQYYLEDGLEKCRWVAMGAANKAFKDDPTADPPVYDFSRMLGWVTSAIGPNFTARAEELMATELGDTPVELLDIEPFCLSYVTHSNDVVTPQ